MKLISNLNNLNLLMIGIYLFVLTISLWIIIYMLIPPTFSGTDILYFKDAGINLAMGAGLTTRTGPGNPGIEPALYANYPPLFIWLFAIFAKIFGISPKTSRIYDLLLTGIAGMMFWIGVQPGSKNRTRQISSLFLLLFLLLALPAGPFWALQERPDSLSFILTISSWLILRSRFNSRTIFLSSLILGINGLVSPFGFTLNAMGLVFFFIANKYERSKEQPLLPLPRMLMMTAFGAAIPILIVGTIAWLADPSTIQRFYSHATGKAVGGRAGIGCFLSLLSGNPKFYLSAFSAYASLDAKIKIAYLLLVTFMILLYLVGFTSIRHQRKYKFFALIIMILGVYPVLFFPYQLSYMSMTAALMLVLFVHIIANETAALRALGHWIIVACLVCLSICEIPYIFREIVVADQCGPSFYHMKQILKQLTPLNGKKSLLVATNAANYFLFKGNGYDIVNIAFLNDPVNRSRVDIFALSFVGSGNPLKPMYLSFWDPNEYELIYRPSLPQQTKIFGYPVSNSSNTWEVELFKRK